MNRHVHYTLTRQWAQEEGFSAEDAEVIALNNVMVDQLYRWRGLCNVKWHSSLEFAHELLGSASRDLCLEKLGKSLHVVQDYCAHRHGLGRILGITYLNPKRHFDLWGDPAAPPEIQIDVESETRRFLRMYRAALHVAGAEDADMENEVLDAEDADVEVVDAVTADVEATKDATEDGIDDAPCDDMQDTQ
jgi:hypothetical protein